jgi:hypothetical protein
MLPFVMSVSDSSNRSSISDAPTDVDGQVDLFDASTNFRFVPTELAAECRLLVKRYHAKHGYSCLPDILWRSEAGELIERNRPLRKVFQKACKRRRAKQADDALMSIAAIVLSLEVLARDWAGWGRRFPDAKQKAASLLGDLMLSRQIWLMQTYL